MIKLNGFVFILIVLSCNLISCDSNESFDSEASFTKPWTYWWWMGSSVSKQGITENMEAMQSVGIGGVHIIVIYGEKGDEHNYIDFLSPKWMEMLKYTTDEAKRLGMGVDMTNYSAWPFGGPNVSIREAAKKMCIKEIEFKKEENIKDYCRPITYYNKNKISVENKDINYYIDLVSIAAYDEKGHYRDVTSHIDSAGFIHWGEMGQEWKVYALFQIPTFRRQNSAGPGGEGWTIDHFNNVPIKNYMKWFENKFKQAGIEKEKVRAFYNDSYELFRANWTPNFLSEFKERRGYELQPFIKYLADTTSCEIRRRVVTDYCETISDLLYDKFTKNWIDECHKMGLLTRHQAHGSPGNLLDLYALSDIPETETFGPSNFTIPGLRTDPDYNVSMGHPNPLVMKFASSAAHVAGRKFVSSESTTWLAEHFKVSLSQIKPEIDQLFSAGINHIFFHGTTYSPKEKKWPGRLFFASTNYNQQSHFWNELPALTEYISKCQTILQNSIPDNDILLYFPIHEVWKNELNKKIKSKPDIVYQFEVHNTRAWLQNSSFGNLAQRLWNDGYTFDYVSDRMISNLKVNEDGYLFSGKSCYKTIVLPQIETIPLNTLILLEELAEKGATIIFENDIPEDIPGLFDLKNQKVLIKELKNQMLGDSTNIHVTTDLFNTFSKEGIYSEELTLKGLEFIRKRNRDTTFYFITNLSERFSEDWLTLNVNSKFVEIYDPVNEKRGNAAIRKSNKGKKIYLQLKPGESVILTCSNKKTAKSNWEYLQLDETQKLKINGPWFLSPTQSIDGSEVPPPDTLQYLTSWTKLGDQYETFSGKVHYSTSFEVPEEYLSAKKFLLDLGNVRESAKVKINGKHIGLAWCIPFQLIIPGEILQQKNTIEIEVTNLSFNRVIKLDKEGIKWKNFHKINFVNIQYKPFDASAKNPEDSGLLSPIYLIPNRTDNELKNDINYETLQVR